MYVCMSLCVHVCVGSPHDFSVSESASSSGLSSSLGDLKISSPLAMTHRATLPLSSQPLPQKQSPPLSGKVNYKKVAGKVPGSIGRTSTSKLADATPPSSAENKKSSSTKAAKTATTTSSKAYPTASKRVVVVSGGGNMEAPPAAAIAEVAVTLDGQTDDNKDEDENNDSDKDEEIEDDNAS